MHQSGLLSETQESERYIEVNTKRCITRYIDKQINKLAMVDK